MSKEYKISEFSSEKMLPEETLVDSFSLRSKLERPVSRRVFYELFSLLVLVMLVFGGSAWQLAVKEGAKWQQRALANRSVVYDFLGARGEIMDRTGKVLAANQPVFDLLAVTNDLPKDSSELQRWLKDLREILSMPADTLEEIFNQKEPPAIFFVKKELSKEQALQIEYRFKRGFYVLRGAKRFYPQAEVFAHLLGYTGKVTEKDLAQDDFYRLSDRRGRSGLEASYETYLRGEHGQIFFDRSRQRYQVLSPPPGLNLVTTLDRRVQNDLFKAMQETLKANGLKFGSAVVLNPQNGEVLGLVSLPSFDNNQLAGEISQETYQRHFLSAERPLFNRAIGGQYQPGSTIKALLALAGLKEGVITPQTTITDQTGYILLPNIYNPEITYIYRDWKVQGTVDLKKALAQSSDIYFYSVGGGYGKIKGLGLAMLEKYLRLFGVDQVLNLDLPGENAGFVPSEEWKKEKFGQPWFTGDTYNISIGQGDLLVTPLWLASYAAVLANGGTIYQPRLVKEVVDMEGQTIQKFGVQPLKYLKFAASDWQTVREALREVVVSGTGQFLKDLPVEVAAKTGTAEVAKGRSLNSLLVAYAPDQQPEIALAVVVEGISQSQQGLASQVAREFLKRYFDGSSASSVSSE